MGWNAILLSGIHSPGGGGGMARLAAGRLLAGGAAVLGDPGGVGEGTACGDGGWGTLPGG